MESTENTSTEHRAIRRGDLYWIGADAEGSRKEGLAHPHVVLQDDVLNASRLDRVVVCALTSNLAKTREPGNVLLGEGEGDLPQRSVVIVSQVSSVEKRHLGARIGTLSPTRVDQILRGMRFQQRSCPER